MTITIAWVGVLGWRSMNPQCTRGGGIWQLNISNTQTRLKGEKPSLTSDELLLLSRGDEEGI